MSLIYLASPYSHPDQAVMESRYKAAVEAAAALMVRGHLVLSPIAHSHHMAPLVGGGTWEMWSRLDRRLLAAADEIWVLKLDGWEESEGVEAETRIALDLGMPLAYVTWPELEVRR